MQHYDLLIATPGSSMEAEYVQSLVMTLQECNKRNISYKFLNGYSSLVHHAREATATGNGGLFLDPTQKSPLSNDTTYNKIFWIDSDIAWSVTDFFKLYDSDYDIVSGAYLLSDTLSSTIGFEDEQKDIKSIDIIKMNSPVKVKSVGFGFIAIKSGVFEKIKRPWFAHEYTVVGQNLSGEDIIDSLGEDISWCIKAKNAGFDIYFDPSVLVTHMKKQYITWDHIRMLADKDTFNKVKPQLEGYF